MIVELGSIEHLSQVISQAVAPSFLLGAVVGFISILFGRTHAVVERIQSLDFLPDDARLRSRRTHDPTQLRRRLGLLHASTLAAICAGATVTVIIVIAFAFALVGWQHLWTTAALFIISLAFFCISLVLLGAEVVVVLHENDSKRRVGHRPTTLCDSAVCATLRPMNKPAPTPKQAALAAISALPGEGLLEETADRLNVLEAIRAAEQS
jgi:hypothetical protein